MQAAAGASLIDATPPADPSARSRPRRRQVVVLALVTLGVYALDQVSKALAVAHLHPGDAVSLVGDWLQLRLIRNPGAAFSFATGMTWLLTLVAVAVVVVVVRSARRLASLPWAIVLGLLLGGALGNLTDRLVREPGVGRGHVVDFIAYGQLFIGNVADIAIVVAAAGVVVLGALGTSLEGSHGGRHLASRQPDDATPPVAAAEAAQPGAAPDAPSGSTPPDDRRHS